MKKYIGLLILSLFIPALLRAQHDLTLYQMERVPQRLTVNPSFIPESSFMGIPFLSNSAISFSEPFRYNQVFKRNGQDTLEFQSEIFLETFSKNSRIHTTWEYALFSFGMKIAHGKFFLNFGLKQKLTQDIYLPDEFFSMLWYGNGASQYLGQRIPVSPRMAGSLYDEWSAGVAGLFLNNRLSIGINAKYLSGRFNVKTNKADFSFYTDPDFYEIYISSDMNVQTSGIANADVYFEQPVGSILFPGNYGFAADLGASFRINDRIAVNASVIDLGFIRWRSGNMTYVSEEPGKEFKYSGMNLGDFVEMFTDLNSFGEKLADSLADLVRVDSIEGEHYTSGIPVRYNLSGSYRIDDRSSLNLLLHGISCNDHFYPALSAGYTFNASKAVALNINYNIFNHQYFNIGGGFTLNLGRFQWYMTSDNISGLALYRSTNNFSFRFGVNINS